MRLGAFTTIGRERPRNLIHIVLDNEAHASTGGQPTAATSTDLAAVASACGYAAVQRIATAAAVRKAIAAARDVLTFLHVKVALDAGNPPPRPSAAPADVADRLGTWLRGASG
jgi:phosphonopyruvate decarboxylase